MTKIYVVGKRWFEKTNGNTYHSSCIYYDGKCLYVPIQYGYGNHFKYTAYNAFINAYPETKLSQDEFITSAYFDVVDVPRKKDLAKPLY